MAGGRAGLRRSHAAARSPVSVLALAAGGAPPPGTGCRGPPHARHVRRGGAGRREARPAADYFPRSFTISKKQPGLRADIAGAPRGGGPRSAASAAPPAAGAGAGAAKRGGRQRRRRRRPPAARGASPAAPGAQGSGPSLAAAPPSLRLREQTLLLSRAAAGLRLHGRARSLGGTVLRGSGRRAAGRGGRGAGGGPSQPSRALLALLLRPLRLAGGEIHQESLVAARQGLLGPASHNPRSRRRRRRLVTPQLWAPGAAGAPRPRAGGGGGADVDGRGGEGRGGERRTRAGHRRRHEEGAQPPLFSPPGERGQPVREPPAAGPARPRDPPSLHARPRRLT